MKKTKTILITLILVVVLGILGCRTLIDSITPSDIDKRAQEYSKVPDKDIGKWKSLNDAVEVRKEIIIKHRTEQIDLKRKAQDDKILYKDAIGFIDANIQESLDLQGIIIGGPDNPFSVLGMLAPFGIGAIAGSVFIKRRNDYSPEEYETGVEKAKIEGEKNAT
ncbi:hypothetical protein LCGC14_2200130 [marine sediment metagenome]|uniref:Uncharacterized protein n=1 Tax=marine sediment metagenome TaxID=412755 RepID=A0A0F9DH72_9ZZZZ